MTDLNKFKYEKKVTNRPAIAIVILLGGLISLLFALATSISLGAANIDLNTVWSAIFRFNYELTHHQIIYELRMPRALVGALVGAGFAVAGSIMQGMTRNPLAAQILWELMQVLDLQFRLRLRFFQVCPTNT